MALSSLKQVLPRIKPTREDSPSPAGSLSPIRSSLAAFFHDRGYISASSSEPSDDDSAGLSKKQRKRRARQERRLGQSRLSEEYRAEEHRRRRKDEVITQNETPEMRARYGDLPLVQSQHHERRPEPRVRLDDLSVEHIGQPVFFIARLDNIRNMSARLVFLVFRQQLSTFQGVLEETPGLRSLGMIQWAEHLRTGTIVRVHGTVQAVAVPVQSCSIHDIELAIEELHVVVRREESIPFSVYEAELLPTDNIKSSSSKMSSDKANGKTRKNEKKNQAKDEHRDEGGDQEEENEEGDKNRYNQLYSHYRHKAPWQDVQGRQSIIPDRVRLGNRILDLRTGTSQAIFRLQAAVGRLFRAALDDRGFIEIHTPKLQGSATESGASVFELNYFGRPAYLAQSPQLAKQMAVAADFDRVYEIGAVFRAENSNTHRHLTEFTGLDLEMAIEEHYHEMLETVDAVLKSIFDGLYAHHRREVDAVRHQFPSKDLVWLDETPVLRFVDAVRLLQDSGWCQEDGRPLREDEDLHTRDEIRLGQLVRERYGTDYFIVDKFPATARPFYTMPDPEDSRYTNSFDIFVRGQEIVSGGQRIHNPRMLEDSMRRAGIDPASMDDYMEGFRWGAPPHGGAGIGLERLLMLLLQLGNIRLASLFHRDPKSFPPRTPITQLRHPEASTVDPARPRRSKEYRLSRDGRDEPESEHQLPPLEDLIANYGDATSTSWLDDRYRIWRDQTTGAAVSYIPINGFSIIPGEPLCDPSQFSYVIHQFLIWLRRQTKLKPIWILVSPSVEQILSEKFGWRSISCVAEAWVNPAQKSAAGTGEISRKIRHAESEGVKISTIPQGELVPDGSDGGDNTRAQIDQRIQDWLASRKGTQIHLSDIHPWRDHCHRWYFYAADRDGRICGFVALAMLSPRHGMQIKYSLDFPGAPSGTIEHLITHAIQTAAHSGVKRLTFGAGATAQLVAGHHVRGTKVRILQRTYEALVKQFHLTRKSEFRIKLGAQEEPLYIAHPPHGLGSRGIRAILKFVED
ncbi:hypothetical protein V8E54_000590 [Elaphomyces granulatus]